MSAPLAIVLESTVEASCPQVELDELRENSEEIAGALQGLGYRTQVVPCPLDLEGLRTRLLAEAPELVFNIVDSIEGKGNLIAMAPMLLAHMGLAYTGANALSTTVSCDKLMTKHILQSAGIRTAPLLTERQIGEGGAELDAPYILKSITEHASFGMFADSVVKSRAELRERWQEKKAKYGSEWFAEQYVDGREFNLSVLADEAGGARVLPAAEIVFTDIFPKDKPRIVDYAAKWYEDSNECKGTVRRFDFPAADAPLIERISAIAMQCWRDFGLTGYARVDFRIDEAGEPYVLEVNCNPFLTAQEGFGAAAARMGLSFTQVVGRIAADAYRRAAKTPPKALAA